MSETKYIIKGLIDKGLDIERLPEEKKNIYKVISNLSQNFTIENDKALFFDEVLSSWIKERMPELLPKEDLPAVVETKELTSEEKMHEDILFLKNIAEQSDGFVSFSEAFIDFVFTEDNDLKYYLKGLMHYANRSGLKVCMATSYRSYNIVGGGNIDDYIDNFDEKIKNAGALGMYMTKYNIIYIPSSEKDFAVLLENATRGYGVDLIYSKENVAHILFTVYLHEVIHAVLSTQSKISDNYCAYKPEIASFLTILSQAEKMNKLTFLKPIQDHWQEMISHLVSNKKYYNLVAAKGYSIHLNRVLLACTDGRELKELLINVINEFTKFAFSKPTNLLYSIPDYTSQNLFLNRDFFVEYPDRILGEEVDTTNRFGKPIKITKRFSGDRNNDDVLSHVKYLPFIDFEFLDNMNKLMQFADTNETIEIVEKVKRREAEKEAEQGVPVVEYGDIITFKQSVQIYNKQLTRLELECYLYCYPDENKSLWFDDDQFTTDEILKSVSEINLNKGFDNESTIKIPTVIFNGYKNEFFSIFLHGDSYSKRTQLINSMEDIVDVRGQEYYDTLIASMDSIKAVEISFDNDDYAKRPFISPVSELAHTFKVQNYIGNSSSNPRETSLINAFIDALSSSWYKSSKYEGVKYTSIIDVLKGERLVERTYRGKPDDLTAGQKQKNDEDDMNNAIEVNNTLEQAYIAFSDFIKESIDEESKQKLTDKLTEFNNKFTFTQLSKVPVGFTHSSRFKRLKKFHLSDVQRDSIAFLNLNKSGLLAYDVGVGKTLAMLMTISNRFDTGNANKALVISPASVHPKWINDTKDYVETVFNPKTKENEQVVIRGSLPHLNVVDLGNLNNDKVMSLKDYTSDEKKGIADAQSGYVEFSKKLKDLVAFDEELLNDNEEQEEDELESGDVGLEKVTLTEKKVTKKNLVLFKENDPKLTEKKVAINELFAAIPIQVFEQFGITNDENKTVDKIYGILRDAHDYETMNPMYWDIYSALGAGKKDYFANIPSYIHLTVIVNIVKMAYKNLQSYLIATTGTLRKFQDKTIFFASMPALERFGFKDETIQTMIDQLMTILHGTSITDGSKESRKKMLEYEEKIGRILRNSIYNARIFFEDFGFDFIGLDEAHNYKNLITTVTKSSTDELSYSEQSSIKTFGGSGMSEDVKGGTVSKRALLAFMSTMYIQLNNRGNNSCLLTATPFTNSSLEIYSMLTLSKYDYLTKLSYDSVQKFVDDFVKLTTQLSVSVDGSIKPKTEPTGYNNLNLLKKIIYTVMDFKTGEEALVHRPCKIVLPIKEKTTICDTSGNLKFVVEKPIPTITTPTYEQQLIFDALQTYLLSQVDKQSVDLIFLNYIRQQGQEAIHRYLQADINDTEAYEQAVNDLAGRILLAFNVVKDKRTGTTKVVDKLFSGTVILKVLAALRNVAVSPYMFRPYTEMLGLSEDDIPTDVVIEKSSKLLLTLGCIKKANRYFDENKIPRKGFVIYSNLGVNKGVNSPVELLKRLKEYMLDPENKMGYSKGNILDDNTNKRFSEVEIMSGGDSSKSGKIRKQTLMKLFNEGKIKVIITTVKEGVDLQGNTIGLFNLSVDWNPTDAKQIEGRSWRQGNKNAYIIVSYPLTANSSDMAIYQKLQDKTSRLKAVIEKGNTYINEFGVEVEVKSQFDLGEFNPEELKTSMISRVDKLAPFLYMDEMQMLKVQYRLLESRYQEDSEVINDYQKFYAHIDTIRNSMHLMTRLPMVLTIVKKAEKLTEDYETKENDIVVLNEQIEEAETKAESYDEYLAVSAEAAEINKELTAKKSQLVDAIGDEDEAKEAKIKAEMKAIKVRLENQLKVIDKAKEKVEKEAGLLTKDIRKKIEAETKELQKIKAKIDEIADLDNFKPYGDENFKPEFQPEDTVNTNYFIKSEDTGKYIYKHEKQSLDKIDWYKATIEDLLEGLKRIEAAYKDGTQLYQAFIEYGRYDNINLKKLNEKYKNFLPEQILSDLDEYYGRDEIPVSLFLSLATEIKATYNSAYWYSVKSISLIVNQIRRALKEYRAVVGDNDPQEYLQSLKEKVKEMKEKVGNDSIVNIPDAMIKKYLDKAEAIIAERKKEYGNFVALIDAYDSLKVIMNKPYPTAIAEKQESVEQIEVVQEVVEEKEKPVSLQSKADNLRTMIKGLEMLTKRAKGDKKANLETMVKGLSMLLKRAEKKAQGGVIMEQGGAIVNQYENLTPESAWWLWEFEQRRHFMFDHETELKKLAIETGEEYMNVTDLTQQTQKRLEFLPKYLQITITNHVIKGQYASGGEIIKRWGNQFDELNLESNDENFKAMFLDWLLGISRFDVWFFLDEILGETQDTLTEKKGRDFSRMSDNELKEYFMYELRDYYSAYQYYYINRSAKNEFKAGGSVGFRNGNPELTFNKVDYHVNIDLKTLEVDVNIDKNDSVNQHALNDTESDWEQHNWGYMVYPKTMEQLFNVLSALKVRFNKKSVESLLLKSGFVEKKVDDSQEFKKGGDVKPKNTDCPVGMVVQSLLFDKGDYGKSSAKKWAEKHQYKSRINESPNYYRMRQMNVDKFQKGSLRTINFSDSVKAIVGCPIN
jgi:hypothetical protein